MINLARHNVCHYSTFEILPWKYASLTITTITNQHAGKHNTRVKLVLTNR